MKDFIFFNSKKDNLADEFKIDSFNLIIVLVYLLSIIESRLKSLLSIFFNWLKSFSDISLLRFEGLLLIKFIINNKLFIFSFSFLLKLYSEKKYCFQSNQFFLFHKLIITSYLLHYY